MSAEQRSFIPTPYVAEPKPLPIASLNRHLSKASEIGGPQFENMVSGTFLILAKKVQAGVEVLEHEAAGRKIPAQLASEISYVGRASTIMRNRQNGFMYTGTELLFTAMLGEYAEIAETQFKPSETITPDAKPEEVALFIAQSNKNQGRVLKTASQALIDDLTTLNASRDLARRKAKQ